MGSRGADEWALHWVLAASVMMLVGMIVLTAAGILDAGGWSAFLIGPIVLGGAALGVVAVVVRRLRSGRQLTGTEHSED